MRYVLHVVLILTLPALAAADRFDGLARVDLSGTIVKVDPGKSFVLKDKAGNERTLRIAPETKVMDGEGRRRSPDRIKAQGRAKVTAARDEGVLWAVEVWLE